MSKRSIKVLSVCTSDSSGGAARAAYRIHNAVKGQGVDCRMFVKDKATNDDDILTISNFIPHNPLYDGFDWVRNKFKNQLQHFQWNKYPDRSSYYMSDLRSTDISGALKKIDYDILHLHWINQRFLPLEELPTDKPIVWTLHDSWPFCGVCHYFLNCEEYKKKCGNCPLLRSSNATDLSNKVWRNKSKIYSKLDLHIVAPSQWLGQSSKASSLFKHFPVSVIPNCIDTSVYRPLNENEISQKWHSFIGKETHLVLYGAMNATTDKIKGFTNLLSAISSLKDKGLADFELIIFGADRPIESLSDIVPTHYVGYITDANELVSLYNLASLTIVPSLTENLSCTIMESLSCGTPVVAFDIGGNRDMIEHRVNGYLAQEKDDLDLAEGIRWCLDNLSGENYIPRARESVVRKYSPDVVGKAYTSLYQSVL